MDQLGKIVESPLFYPIVFGVAGAIVLITLLLVALKIIHRERLYFTYDGE